MHELDSHVKLTGYIHIGPTLMTAYPFIYDEVQASSKQMQTSCGWGPA